MNSRSSSGASGKSAAAGALVVAANPEHRRFKLPPHTRVKLGKQTLVQLDVPPEITLAHEIPLPTALLWTETEAPAMRRRFVAPPLRKIPKVTQSLPAAPELEAPNRETNVADLNFAAAFINQNPRLVHPPSVASPVASPGPEKAKEIPQIGLADTNKPSPANLISLPDSPLRSNTALALPPANEIAEAGGANASSSAEDGNGAGNGKAGLDGHGVGIDGAGTGVAAGEGNGAGRNGRGATGDGGGGNGSGSGGSNGNGDQGGGRGAFGNGRGATGSTGNGTGASGTGAGADGSGGLLANDTAGLTRIALPKEGKFGVVVLGSADSTTYPESVGALSGKIVYTVYLKVGLRKSWILQYCLPKASEKRITAKASSTPLEAPWPFLIMRPDRWSDSDPDYIMVHGMLTEAGQFDQLAMVFPQELEKRDFLLHALKLWAFRPASRDGEPTAVEVLLIIPHEPQ